VLGLYALWSAFYLARTSFVADGERVFLLWDDAMISMQYARNLREGHGLVWVPGDDPVQGFSNLGVALVMSVLHFLPLSTARISLAFQALNGALLLGILAGVAWLVRRLFPAAGRGMALAAVVATALSAPLAVWSLQGSDVGFVAAWTVAILALHATRDTDRDAWPSGLTALLGAGLLIRPDTGLTYVVFVAMAALLARRPLRTALGPALVLVGVETCLLLGSYLYYGDPLPNTWYLKATGASRSLVFASSLRQMSQWLPWVVPALGLALAGWWVGRRSRGAWQATALLGAWLAYDFWIGGDWLAQYGGRFFTPLLPLVFVLAAGGSHWLAGRVVSTRPRLRLALAAGALVATAAIATPPELRADWFSTTRDTMVRSFNIRNYLRGLYLRDHTQPDTRIAVHWAGISPYVSRRPAFDLLGKSEPHIARLEVRDRFEPGHSKWDWDYSIAQAPDVFVSVSRGLNERRDFKSEYLLLRSPHLAAGEIPLYVRRTSLEKIRDPDAVVVDLWTGTRRSL